MTTAPVAEPLVTAGDSLFEGEGVIQEADGNRPFLLDDPEAFWLIESGEVQVFAVGIDDDGETKGARSHFVTVHEGECLLGMDLEGYNLGSGFLAVGKVGTNLRRIELERLEELALSSPYNTVIANLIDRWVAMLSDRLTREIIPGPLVDVNLEAEEEVILENTAKARSNRGVLWLNVPRGNLLFIGMETLVFEEGAAPIDVTHASIMINVKELLEQSSMSTLFPLTQDTWVEASNAGDGETELKTLKSADVIGEEGFWRGLEMFHEILCQTEFINKKLEKVDEFNRLKTKAEYAEVARREAFRELALVLERPGEEIEEVDPSAAEDFTLQAAQMVGRALGMTIKQHPEAKPENSFERQLQLIAKSSRFRMREVALRDEWWRLDQGPILAQHEATGDAVALMPKGAKAYEMVIPAQGRREKATSNNVGELRVFAKAFYRPFPPGLLGIKDLGRFVIHGLGKDFLFLIGMGVGLGVLGAMSPYFTGQVFDSAIPQADRNLLVQFGVALFLSAIISTAFKIVQSISVLRIQGKMDYSAQAAVWDRLMELPTNFFRKYAAGDLADRALGINEIRGLLAGTGVGAILGSLSSVFYIFLMFKYSIPLSLAAMGLTAFFIAFSFTCNLMQLRYQRAQLEKLGNIRGLVLQLISGVAKLRVSGAEDHAFKVWSSQFADSRRIGFAVGRIQNYVQVFNSAFMVLSSAVIFFTLATVQQSSIEKGGGPLMSTGDFIAFNAAYMAFLTASIALSDASLSMLEIIPVYERIKPILETKPETDPTMAYPGILKGEIEVSHAHFRYVSDGPWILKDVSTKVNPGDFIALVGGSGSGKSTLMRLMLGFEKPEKGSVYYDGQDLSTLDVREVRSQLGVVLQDSRVFPTDIYKNIVSDDDSLTIDDAWDAAVRAGLDEDIQAMPMGMHTYVSDGGGGLSGGQRQRLLIARCLVRKPRIIFLDEATSALDNRTQSIVTESMKKMQASRVAIAHRLSTIRDADRIIVLDYGVVVEEGPYDELMSLRGRFYELASGQEA